MGKKPFISTYSDSTDGVTLVSHTDVHLEYIAPLETTFLWFDRTETNLATGKSASEHVSIPVTRKDLDALIKKLKKLRKRL